MPNSSADRIVYQSKRPTKQHRRKSWRDRPDSLLPAFNGMPNPESLHPDADTILAAVAGSIRAREIIAAWAPTFPVVVVAR